MSLRRRRVAHADYDASGETAVMHDEICSFPTAGGTCLGDVWPVAAQSAANPKTGSGLRQPEEKDDAEE